MLRKMNERSKEWYLKSAKVRDKLLRPVVSVFSKMGLTANMITYSSIISMVLFVMSIKRSMLASVVFLIYGIGGDLFDGVLARYQGKQSDKGKFIDMVADNLNFALFVIGLSYGGLIQPLVGTLIVYFMILSKVFRSIWNSLELKSDWYFKTVAGALPNVVVALTYILFFGGLIFGWDYLTKIFYVFSGILLVDGAVFYRRIVYDVRKK